MKTKRPVNHRIVGVSVSIMLLTGCTSLSTMQDNLPWKAGSSNGASAITSANAATPVINVNRPAISAEWWQRFNDPQMTSLIQIALQAHPNIRSAQASLQSARAKNRIAGASLLPTVNSSASASRNNSGDSYSLGIGASWEADIFGANGMERDATGYEMQSAQANLEDVKAALAAEVATTYVLLRSGQASLAISQQGLSKQEETFKLVSLKQQAGLATGLAVDQASLSLGQTKAKIPAQQNSINQSQAALVALTGLSAEEITKRVSGTGSIPSVSFSLLNNIPADMIRQRPDIRMAEYGVLASSLRVSISQTALYPSLSLSGSLGLSSLSLSDLIDPAEIAKSLIASITAPLFNGGKLRQQVVIQQSSEQVALANYDKAIRSAINDIADALSDLQSLRQQEPILVNNLQLARSNEKLSQLSYEAGEDDFTSVLTAQSTTLSAEQSLSAAKAEFAQAVIRVYKAIGGAW